MKRIELEEVLIDALADLIEQKPVTEIKVSELIKTAKVPKTTFYRLYDSLDDFIINIEDNILEEIRNYAKYFIAGNIYDSVDKPVNEHVHDLFKYLYNNRKIYMALMSPNGDQMFVYKNNQMLKEFYGGKVAFEGYQSAYPTFYMLFALAGHEAIIKHWLEKCPEITPKEMSMIAQDLMYGLYKKKE